MAIAIRELTIDEADRLQEVDRSEWIERIYIVQDGELRERTAGHECPAWSPAQLEELQGRLRYELANGGKAYGAFDLKRLVGFAVLGHKRRGEKLNQLQVDLMYVSRPYRRKGIGKRLMSEICEEAARRGAEYLYISSTETDSAVGFYRSWGSEITAKPDPELYALEPNDIHMVRKL